MDALLRHDTHLVSDRITRTDQSITINYTKHTDRCESLHLNSVLSYNTATGKHTGWINHYVSSCCCCSDLSTCDGSPGCPSFTLTWQRYGEDR